MSDQVRICWLFAARSFYRLYCTKFKNTEFKDFSLLYEILQDGETLKMENFSALFLMALS